MKKGQIISLAFAALGLILVLVGGIGALVVYGSLADTFAAIIISGCVLVFCGIMAMTYPYQYQKKYQLIKATEAELKSFDWLPLDQWTVERTFNTNIVNNKQLCKICDKWEAVSELKRHVKSHTEARKRIKKREREEALKRAREMRKLKKQERAKA